jgi:hypothetical protein
MNMNDTTFRVGTKYSTGEGRDYVWRYVVLARTAKFVTLRDLFTGDDCRVGVKVSPFDGIEYALPLGSYANAPAITADRVL